MQKPQYFSMSCFIIPSLLFVAGCSNSQRSFNLDGADPRRSNQNIATQNRMTQQNSIAQRNIPRTAYNVPTPADENFEPITNPRGAVSSSNLPDLAPSRGGIAANNPPISSPLSPPSTKEATRTATAAPNNTAASERKSGSVYGNWTAREATGSNCRLTLSSSPALDLYKASSTGCANKDLSKISAWDQREGEIYLYQSGGAVIARLRPAGTGYTGVVTKSGAALGLER
jgi:hypothetical protein